MHSWGLGFRVYGFGFRFSDPLGVGFRGSGVGGLSGLRV